MRTPEDQPPPAGDLIRFATVETVDLAAARCVVRVGELLTGPIRWIEAAAGATRTWSPPAVGEQVLLLCAEGELEMAVALRGITCAAFPPIGDSLRELVRFEDGAEIAYDPETHKLEAMLPAGATVAIEASGGITIDASEGGIAIIGDVSVEGDVVARGVSLVKHRHQQVRIGTDLSGEPA